MRIGTKLLLLLLALAAGPLGLAVWQAREATRELGHELAAEGRAMLENRIAVELRRTTEFGATVLEQRRRTLEGALRFMAADAARRLATEPPSGTAAPGIDGHAYVVERTVAPPGEQTVRLDRQSFLVAADSGLDRVRDDIIRMAPMTPVLRALYSRNRDVVLWQFVSLESGLHAAFPGHDGYPPGYDGRERDWYVAAIEAGGTVWSRPYADATTGELVVTVSTPVLLADGTIAGVAGIDLRLLRVLAEVHNRASLPADAAAMLLAFPDGDEGPRVIARIADDGQWRALDEAMGLAGEGEGFESVLADMRAGAPGFRRLVHRGVDSLWSYGPAGERLFLLTVTPFGLVEETARLADRAVARATTRQLREAALFAAVLLVLAVAAAFLGARGITRPVKSLHLAARRLARGDFRVRAEVTSRDEIGELSKSFNELVPQLEEQMRVRQSLAVAREIHQNLLPKAPPEINGYDIAGRSVACDETGGDYLDYLPLGLTSRRVVVALGDVTGHGLGPALLMTTARALLRGLAGTTSDPAQLVDAVNRHLAADAGGGRFMTLSLIVLEPGADTIEWVSAGHDPALLFDPAGDDFRELADGGIPLGVDEAWRYAAHRVERVSPGRVLVTATDGLWEAKNANGEMFGKQRMKDAVREAAGGSAREILDAVLGQLDAFRGDKPFADDVSLVVVKRV